MSEELVKDETGTQNNTEPPEESKDELEKPEGQETSKPEDQEAPKPEDQEKKPDEGEPEVPEEYQFPEGVELTDEQKKEYSELFKKYKAPQEAVNEVFNRMKEFGEQVREASMNAWYDQVKKWGDAAEKDKEYGGDNFEQNLRSVISPTLDRFGTPELVDALDKTGFGNYPELLRFIYRVGKEIGIEGDFVKGGQGGEEEQSLAYTLYPTMRKQK